MSKTAYIFFGTPLAPARVTSRTQKRFVKALNDVLAQNYTKLVVSITSEGGYCDDGFIMYHALRQAAESIEVHTHAVLDCASMAAVLHMAGEKRTFAPATIFSFHAAARDDVVDPVYNTRMHEVYHDRAGWNNKEFDTYLAGVDLVMPTPTELASLRVVTQAKPMHVPYALATHTIH